MLLIWYGVDENYIIMLNGLRFKGRIGGSKNSLLEADSIIVIFHQVVLLLFCVCFRRWGNVKL